MAQRYTDDELHVDRHGVPAGETLFVDKMPPTYTEAELRELIVSDAGSAAALVNIWFGTKPLGPGEFRTSTVRFSRVDAAVECRRRLQYYKSDGWEQGLQVNFSRAKRSRPLDGGGDAKRQLMGGYCGGGALPGGYPGGYGGYPGGYCGYGAPGYGAFGGGVGGMPGAEAWAAGCYGAAAAGAYGCGCYGGAPGAPSGSGAHSGAAVDGHGTPACPTLFLSNLPRGATEDTVRLLFPNATGVYCSNKYLNVGERRTSYVSLPSAADAIATRARLDNTPMGAHPPLVPLLDATCGPDEKLGVHFSKRGQERVYSQGEVRPPEARASSGGSYAGYGGGYNPNMPPGAASAGGVIGGGVGRCGVGLMGRPQPRGAGGGVGVPCATLFCSGLPP